MSGQQSLPVRLIARSGLAALTRSILLKNQRIVLGFHGVTPRRYPDIPRPVQPSLSVAELETITLWLKKRFAFINPQQLLQGTNPGILLTFDDGLASNYHHALPLLEKYDIPAIFFVTVQHVRDPKDWLSFNRQMALTHWESESAVPEDLQREFFDGLSEQELRAAASHPLITIGGHTLTHPHLPDCHDAQLEAELVESKRALEEIIDQPVDLFAYPYGDYDRRVAEVAQTAGYEAAFAVKPIKVGLPRFEIPRIDLYWSDSAYLDLKLSGLLQAPARF